VTHPAGRATDAEQALLELATVVNDLDERLAAAEACIARGQWDQHSPQELTGWVEQLRETYQLRSKLTDSWAHIPAVVAELTALRTAHRAAWGPTAGPTDQMHWHDALARAVPRLLEHQAEHRKLAAGLTGRH